MSASPADALALRHGPILSTLVRLALPNVLAMLLTVLRGSGNMRVPSAAIVLSALLQIALGGVLGLGAGPVPAFGMVGVAAGHIIATSATVAVLGWFLSSGRARVRLAWRGPRLDPALLAYSRQYLQTVGPAFPLFGLGLTLYFASQGAGRMLGPVLAGALRLLLVAGAGAWLAGRNASPASYFVLVSCAMAAYGLATALAVRLTPWGSRAA